MTSVWANVEDLRQHAADLCEYAVNGAIGRVYDDPVYVSITGGRDPGPKYSSCGDLAHWMLYRLGCRESWVNVTDKTGDAPRAFRYGKNVSLLTYTAKGILAKPVPAHAKADLRRGDVCVTWPPGQSHKAHVFVFDRLEGTGAKALLHTWDLGQDVTDPVAWAKEKVHVEARRRVRSATLPICAHLSLERLPFTADPLPVPDQ